MATAGPSSTTSTSGAGTSVGLPDQVTVRAPRARRLPRPVAWPLRLVALLAATSVVTFALVAASPVDPVKANLGQAAYAQMSEPQRAELAEYWGADTPLPQRYAHWLGALAHGDLGPNLPLALQSQRWWPKRSTELGSPHGKRMAARGCPGTGAWRGRGLAQGRRSGPSGHGCLPRALFHLSLAGTRRSWSSPWGWAGSRWGSQSP